MSVLLSACSFLLMIQLSKPNLNGCLSPQDELLKKKRLYIPKTKNLLSAKKNFIIYFRRQGKNLFELFLLFFIWLCVWFKLFPFECCQNIFYVLLNILFVLEVLFKFLRISAICKPKNVYKKDLWLTSAKKKPCLLLQIWFNPCNKGINS